MWAPVPVFIRKIASFHVDDRKGFYYCFDGLQRGCDLFCARDRERKAYGGGREFWQREAGMPHAKAGPPAQEKADRRTQLAEVMELAVQ